jgi:tetratricopeptide (TPR) repeat protein
VPSVINFGLVQATGNFKRSISMALPGSVVVRPELAGLRARTEQASGHAVVLHLELDTAALSAGALIDSRIEVEAAGLLTWIRLTGRVASQGHAGRPDSSQAASASSSSQLLLRAWGESSPRLSTAPESEADAPIDTEPSSVPPAWGDSLLRLAHAARLAGDLDRALELLTQATAVAPTDPHVHAERAALFERQGAILDAVSGWQRVLGLDRSYRGAHQHLARCLNQLGRFTEAIAALEQGLQLANHRQDPEFLRALASAYFGGGRRDEAIWALDQALKIKPDSKAAALRAAWLRG